MKIWPAYLPPKFHAESLRDVAEERLTLREVDVVAGVIGGRINKKIAHLLNVTPKTVDNYLQHVHAKLGSNSKQAIIECVQQTGLHERFKQHDWHLQMAPLFHQLLIQVSQTAQQNQFKFILVSHENDNTVNTMVSMIEQDWQRAGFDINQVKWANLTQALASSQTTHVIIWITPPHSTTKPWDESCIRVCSTLHPRIRWMVIQEDHANTHIPHASIICVSPTTGFYGLMLDVLQTLFPEYDLSSFRAQYTRLMGLGQPLPVVKLPQEASSQPHVGEHLGHGFWLVWLYGVFSVLCLAGVWYWQTATRTPDDVDTTWNLPPVLSHYTERPNLTQQIWHQLQQDPGKGTVSLVGLRGMGGVGKTTLATEAIHYPSRRYHFRGWFKAETQALLIADYLDLGAKMHLFNQSMTEKQKLIAVKEWLQDQPSTLLVYDNAPDMNTIRNYLPNKGHVLITSRNHHMPHPINIEGMGEPEAITLLDKLIPNILKQQKDYQEQLKILAKELGYLPLALAQAGAYIAEHEIIIPDYLKRYRNSQTQLLAQDILPPGDLHESVYVTWDMNIQSIKQHPKGEEIMQLLDVIACLYPENIPKALLAQSLFQVIDDHAIIQLDALIGLLKTYSLVKSSGNHICIHRLLHAHLRHRYQDSIIPPTILREVIASMETLYQMDPRNYNLLKAIMPHVEYLKTHQVTWLTDQQSLKLNTILAWMHYLFGHHTQAKLLYETVLPTSIELHNELSLQTAEIYRGLGWVCREVGQPMQARIWFEKALPILQQHHGEHHIWSVRIYRGLSWVYYDLGQPLEAKAWLEKALIIVQQHDTGQHFEAARIYRGLGWIYRDLAQPLKAKSWFKKALTIVQQHDQEQHVRTAWMYRSLGWIYYDLGQPLEAKACFEKTLTVVRQQYGEHHISTALLYKGLGWSQLALGHPLEAKTWFKKALLIFEKHYGKQHVWTVVRMYRGLGWAEMDLGHHEQAKAWFEKALLVYQSRYGQTHSKTAQIYDGLGWSELKLGSLNRALSWLHQALSIHQQHDREYHVWSLSTHHGLARVYFKLNQMEPAKIHLKQAQQIVQQHRKKGHQFNQKLLQNLVQLQQALTVQ